ncbi:hypothetical protein [Rheinheimera sp.]|uniref:sulfotransferase family 2 domain-containing protein n=1 Tax=Rheinheimera sp. TaxID=1869214 RepID=UPI00307F0F50
MIISVHVPKCAGSSLRAWYEQQFCNGRILWDYNDLPMQPCSPTNMDPERFLHQMAKQNRSYDNYDIIHGHFWAKKYSHISNANLITFLRNPIKRALSNYFFWFQIPRSGNRLHQYVIDNQLSWKEFVRIPVIRNLYRDIYFRDVDMSSFNFIGNSDNFNSELKRLSHTLGKDFQVHHENKTSGEYCSRVEDILSESSNVNFLLSCFHDDMVFFERYVNV